MKKKYPELVVKETDRKVINGYKELQGITSQIQGELTWIRR